MKRLAQASPCGAARGPVLVLLLAALGGCAVMPSGPSAMALPGSRQSFEQFRSDDEACRQFALQQIGGQTAQRAADDAVAASALTGAAVGALAGAAIGGSQGAGVGAGTGLVVGSAVGSGSAASAGWDAQRRYDAAYLQCMYAHGHKVPVPESAYRAPSAPPGIAPLPPGVPPPPRGAPPPPPPRWRPG